MRIESRRVFFLFVLMCLAAVMEMLTLAAVIPLVSSMVNVGSPDAGTVFQGIPFPDSIANAANLPAIVLGGVLLIVCVASLLRLLVIRTTAEFSARMGVKLQCLYFGELLHRDYQSAINDSSSDNVSLMSHKLQFIITHYLLGVLTTATAIVSTIGIVIMLIWISTWVVLSALLFLGVMYVLIAIFTRRKLKIYGAQTAAYSPRTIRCLQDGLGGIRDVIMGVSQGFFVTQMADLADKVESAKAKLVFYGGFPRPLLEALGIGSIAVIAYLVNVGTLNGANLLPMLGAFSLGMLRLLPNLQQIFLHWSKLIHGQVLLDELMVAMNDFQQAQWSSDIHDSAPSMSWPLTFRKSIELRNVGFSYQLADSAVFNNVNVLISKGEHVGIVGQTGSGKSTLVDIIMGLLVPSEGQLLVDDKVLGEKGILSWREIVAHVPQRIYLADASIAQNIAFAVPVDQIDFDRVKMVAKQAHIDRYIETLSKGYHSQVGENGVRLSGGQRQRLGIARALYLGCEVLVFDEATNALDIETEAALIAGLLEVSRHFTIITVAHNLEAVRHCHRRFEVNNGKVIQQQI